MPYAVNNPRFRRADTDDIGSTLPAYGAEVDGKINQDQNQSVEMLLHPDARKSTVLRHLLHNSMPCQQSFERERYPLLCLHGLSQVSSMQLLHYQAPQAAVLVLLMSPLFDDTGVMLTWARAAYATPEIEAEDDEVELISPETAAVATTVLLSCFLAFLVNLSLFLVIGRTSPVSYQVKSKC